MAACPCASIGNPRVWQWEAVGGPEMMETLPPRSQDPRCTTLGEQPPAHPGRNLQALTSPQEEETSQHHGTRTRGRESHALLVTGKPRGPHKHFPRRPKLHSKPLHRHCGLACVYAGAIEMHFGLHENARCL